MFINNFIYFSIKFWNYLNDTYVNKNLIYDVNFIYYLLYKFVTNYSKYFNEIDYLFLLVTIVYQSLYNLQLMEIILFFNFRVEILLIIGSRLQGYITTVMQPINVYPSILTKFFRSVLQLQLRLLFPPVLLISVNLFASMSRKSSSLIHRV